MHTSAAADRERIDDHIIIVEWTTAGCRDLDGDEDNREPGKNDDIPDRFCSNVP
jgi:hypothetical protein